MALGDFNCDVFTITMWFAGELLSFCQLCGHLCFSCQECTFFVQAFVNLCQLQLFPICFVSSGSCVCILMCSVYASLLRLC